MLKDNLFGNNPDPKNDAVKKVTIQEVRELARARTLTALQGLDPDRKGRLVQFLYEAQLIGFAEYAQNGTFQQIHNRIIDLSGADFLTQQDLDQVYSCKYATLPEGLI